LCITLVWGAPFCSGGGFVIAINFLAGERLTRRPIVARCVPQSNLPFLGNSRTAPDPYSLLNA
jgi:hypothetical protein